MPRLPPSSRTLGVLSLPASLGFSPPNPFVPFVFCFLFYLSYFFFAPAAPAPHLVERSPCGAAAEGRGGGAGGAEGRCLDLTAGRSSTPGSCQQRRRGRRLAAEPCRTEFVALSRGRGSPKGLLGAAGSRCLGVSSGIPRRGWGGREGGCLSQPLAS